ncbi:GNAT family N-acetyltransferase [Streptomyces sp. 142MFCol3.1]|uniref:GNAT family N-acetyltransferase n=1 Tax=Streptomyces sp. 142MFCol3.1 TaxID=1172179 RepID=UPI001319E6E8|nr:GNAT family N-acetyltransferase [Streptomyces sp. 142MFCol3.1]
MLNELSEGLHDQLLDVDHDPREAPVALDSDEIIGVARYAATSEVPRLAAVSVLVADAWQRQGIARDLLIRLRGGALQRGIAFFEASVLATNDRAQPLLRVLAPEHRVLRRPDGLEFRWSHFDPTPLPALPPSHATR